MHKIVIITDYSEKGDKLIECLSVLFPECEIQIVPKLGRNFENLQAVPGPAEKQSPEDRVYDDQQKYKILRFPKTG